ncbi:MAG: beta-lactamase family protein [Oscillospiraceae bacterium]|nr:beta-lactamase family protein [Oscillospiraceae bacterium]
MFENVKAMCQSFLKMGVPYFDVIIYKDGKEILRYMDGYTDVENKIPVRGDELLNVYSNSKPVTVVAALQLWEKGLFDLEDELWEYLPEYKEMTVQTETGIVPAKNPINIWHLFTMTAGFHYNNSGPWLDELRKDTFGRCPTREVARYLAKSPLIYEPGTDYRYSLAHDVLAALVEVVSGQAFNDYVTENIFAPLGMTHSTFLYPYDRLPAHYDFVQEEKTVRRRTVNEFRFGPEHASGGAGLVTTVDDYVKFAEALRTYKLLKKETTEMIAKNWLTDEQHEKFGHKVNYYYGFGMRTAKPGTARADFGWGGAAGSMMNVDIPHGITVFYSQHLRSSPNMSIRSRVYEALLKDLGYDIEVTIPDPEENNLTY